MTGLVSLVQAGEGVEGVTACTSTHTTVHAREQRAHAVDPTVVHAVAAGEAIPTEVMSWGPRGRMQGDGRPHSFMGHRGGFQGMPPPGGTLQTRTAMASRCMVTLISLAFQQASERLVTLSDVALRQ